MVFVQLAKHKGITQLIKSALQRGMCYWSKENCTQKDKVSECVCKSCKSLDVWAIESVQWVGSVDKSR